MRELESIAENQSRKLNNSRLNNSRHNESFSANHDIPANRKGDPHN